MNIKIIASIILPVFLLQVVGCYSQDIISKEDLNKERDKNIQIITNNNKKYEAESDYWYVGDDTLVLSPNFRKGLYRQQKIPVDSVQTIYTSYPNTSGMIIFFTPLVLIITVTAVVAHEWGH